MKTKTEKQRINNKEQLKTSKEYEDLGRAVVSIFESGAVSRTKLYSNSFLKGVLAGFGGVIGATVGIALFLWVLSWFDSIWLIGDFVVKIQQAILSAQ